jgi:hypothetical protein
MVACAILCRDKFTALCGGKARDQKTDAIVKANFAINLFLICPLSLFRPISRMGRSSRALGYF